MKTQKNAGQRQFQYLNYLIALVFLGYLALAVGYLFYFADRDIASNAVLTAREFTPTLILGMCYLIMSFTCGEFFGLLRYQFNAAPDEPGSKGLRVMAARSLNVFFMCTLCFYFLRAGLKEGLLEKIFFVGMPVFLGGYLIYILKRLNQAHMMAPWYYHLKLILLSACILGQLIANIVLFFPAFLVTIPSIG